LKPDALYYGAKKGLRPLSLAFDYYAIGDNSQAPDHRFQPNSRRRGAACAFRVRIYDLDGRVRDEPIHQRYRGAYNGATQIMTLPRYPKARRSSSCAVSLFDDSGKLIVDNSYWQSQNDDDLRRAVA